MKEVKHGAQYAYKILKCRCDECKKWNTTEQIRYRANRRKKGERLVDGKWRMGLG